MMETECVVRKWGNSLGIILPREIAESEQIEEDEKVFVTFRKKHQAKEFFGLFPGWKKPTEQLKKEMKKGWS